MPSRNSVGLLDERRAVKRMLTPPFSLLGVLRQLDRSTVSVRSELPELCSLRPDRPLQAPEPAGVTVIVGVWVCVVLLSQCVTSSDAWMLVAFAGIWSAPGIAHVDGENCVSVIVRVGSPTTARPVPSPRRRSARSAGSW